ncbi:serine hydrolase [Bacillus mojavensis]|uniref:serine hydrolase domain-containing protein n=1 Tax=Bacillus TaxID=1386 RepID=UPI000287B4F6|nr:MULTISPECIES: serine hydrolase [Bacillus]MCC2930980.1 beta-lactamase family protein [Bacillus sp. LBG-1-113]MDR4228812.1 serine hydrolase [Bacillus mojavensis]MEC1754600.1 serine hydrolase [Bacillus mojavensis]MEC3587085.1 serine hydrolase [Bacillus mojavensis]MEC5242275.1 serine hydrolase [Bacillus mojavensis]
MQRNDWPTEDPAALGMDAEKLFELDPKIKSEYSNINGIVVVKNGYIAYERYYHGYGPNDTHHIASGTKSILSALIGIAIDAGYIKNVDQKVLNFFPEYIPHPADKQKRDITIRHLLTMTAPYPFEEWHEPLDKMCMQPDWVTYTLDMLGQGGTIGTFKYSTAGAHLLSAIITRRTGKSAREFANERLFKPIGVKEIPHYGMQSFGFDDLFGKNVKGWVNDPNGNSTGGWGLTMTPRDMARFGCLYLNHGTWNNQQIIPESWIDQSTAMNANNYGYLWWLRDEDSVFSYSALGDGGNVICCVPEKNLVVAIASEFIMNARDRWQLIKEYLVSQ